MMVYYRVNDFSRAYADLFYSVLGSMRIFCPEFLSCPAAGEVVSSGVPEAVRRRVVEEACSLAGKALGEKDGEKAVIIWKSLLGDRFGAG
ncbi:MAG: hypothetical protein HPY89_03410 [Pelotomaculum sp.]|nr:hypothetical protein [Pelotomaculum sp.]